MNKRLRKREALFRVIRYPMLRDPQERVSGDLRHQYPLIASVGGEINNRYPFVKQRLHHRCCHADVSAKHNLSKVDERDIPDGFPLLDHKQAFPSLLEDTPLFINIQHVVNAEGRLDPFGRSSNSLR